MTWVKRDLGNHTNKLEGQMDNIITVLTHDYEKDTLRLTFRGENLYIRGIPESGEVLKSSVTALFQELILPIPIHRLEIDVHRSLGPKWSKREPLSLQCHTNQIFADLFPVTI